MKRIIQILSIVIITFAAVTSCIAWESGLFRPTPVTTPGKGLFQVSNSSFYSSLEANSVLKTKYGINSSHIYTNLTEAQAGITDNIALTGGFPYYQDLYNRSAGNGRKSGPGDVSVGIRASFKPEGEYLKFLSFGSTMVFPEKFGYGNEPLGYRTFSSGKFAIGIDTSAGYKFSFFQGYLSGALRTYPGAKNISIAHASDTFYDSGFGMLGIGSSDDTGLSTVIMQDQVQLSAGAVIPFTKNIAGLVELSTVKFLEKPIRKDIIRLAPGIRFGNPEKIYLSAAVDMGISGDMADNIFLLKVGIPSISPKKIKDRITGQSSRLKAPRAKNALVAVPEFTSSDIKFLYEKEIKDSFINKLSSMNYLDMTNGEKTHKAFQQMELVPRKDSLRQLGVRLGANYIINADIFDYSVKRISSLNLPLIISVQKSIFSLSARASITDLITGNVYDMGVITATVSKPRGVNYFPVGGADISFLSAPETRAMERELIDKWVDNLNGIIIKNIKVFGWEIKEDKKAGDVDKG